MYCDTMHMLKYRVIGGHKNLFEKIIRYLKMIYLTFCTSVYIYVRILQYHTQMNNIYLEVMSNHLHTSIILVVIQKN